MQAFDRHSVTAPRRRHLDEQIRSLGLPPRDILTELDSAGCDRLEPAAIRTLDRARQRFSANGRRLVVRHASPALRRQLIEEGLAGVLQVRDRDR